ncbi:MAG TPA: helix-turn-helix transcriptional regulator [Terracidiphilus sp.]|nr:helix-turn-helix transcriptional regulator [Terracidiphilus sp.]
MKKRALAADQNVRNQAKRRTLKEMARVNGQRIRELREKLELTQGAFATKCGVSRTAVPLWENGKANPSQRCWSRMALLAREAPAIDKTWFFQQAGLDLEYLSELFPEFGRISRESELRAINMAAAMVEDSTKGATAVPLLRVPANFGRPLSARTEEIEGWLSLPAEMIEKGPHVIAMRISPVFVRPIFGLGDTLIIDSADRDATNLRDALVVASYKPNASTKAAAEHLRRGQPGAEYIKEGIWPLLPEGLYLGWLRSDQPAPTTEVPHLTLVAPRTDESPSPVFSVLPFVIPSATYDKAHSENRLLTEEPEAVVLGRVLAWIASPKTLKGDNADHGSDQVVPSGYEVFETEKQTQSPKQQRQGRRARPNLGRASGGN